MEPTRLQCSRALSTCLETLRDPSLIRGVLHQGFYVVPVGIADERGVGPVLGPMSRLVPRRPTCPDRGPMEGVNRAPIHSLEGQVEASSHVRARWRGLQGKARSILLGDPVLRDGLRTVARLDMECRESAGVEGLAGGEVAGEHAEMVDEMTG